MKILQHKIPDTWQWIEISQIGNIETGTTPSKKDKSNYGVDFPFYKPTELEAGINVRESRERLSKKGIKKARLLPKNSILVTCIGATIGKTGIIRNEGASNQQINSIIPVGSINPNFVYYQVICPFFQNQIIKRSSSTTLPILNKSRFSKLLFALPSRKEQNRIVEKIEELFSDLDKATEDLIKTQGQLKIYRQAVLKAAFEGTLIKNFKYKEISLSKFEHKGGGTPSTKKGEYWNGNINWITSANIDKKNRIHFDKKISQLGVINSSTNIIPKNSVIIVTRVGLGKVAVNDEDTAINQDCQGIICNSIEPYYLMWYLKSIANEFIFKGQGTTINGITISKLVDTIIKVPEKEIQKQIVNEIESRLSVCDKLEETIEQSLNKIEYSCQSILKKAFEGKLVSQDPNDLPACELLKQIKIEKDKMSKNGK